VNLIFMGTPDFAVPSLCALHENGYRISLVVTRPDRPQGRGRRRVCCPVKAAAESLGLELYQPESLREERVEKHLAKVRADLIVVVAFGQILSPALLTLPKRGAVNVHASLLPKYRGPAPIQWAILNMEKETGVTTMRMDQGLDTGDVLLAETVPIGPHDTAETLHDRLAAAGAGLLVRTLRGMEAGTVVPIPQDHSQASYAPMLHKADGKIDWSLPAEKIEAVVRAMTPWPGAYTFWGARRIKIFKAEGIPQQVRSSAGTVVEGFPDELRVAAGTGVVSILELQESSGKRLPVAAFLRGNPIPVGSVFN